MKWINKNGKEFQFADRQYRIDWKKRAPSKGSQAVKDLLFKNYAHLDWYEEYRIPGTRLRVDFLCSNIRVAIEFHGRQHQDFVPFMHGSRSGFLSHIKRDVKKEELLTKNGFRFIEIYEEDVDSLSKKWFEEKLNAV